MVMRCSPGGCTPRRMTVEAAESRQGARRGKRSLALGSLLSLVVAICLAVPAAAEEPLSVFVSIPPQKCFVERVAGDAARVRVLLPPGQSPATYEPTPKQMVALAGADVYFRIGVPFENSVADKVSSVLKGLKIVDLRQGVELRAMSEPHHHHHQGAGGQHEDHGCAGHGETDPHTWMSPRLAQVQTRTICETLCRLDPAGSERYQGNTAAFVAELDALDKELSARLAPLRGREFFVFHPAYGYFAEAYGLRQVAVEAGGKAPTAKQLGQLIRRARLVGVKLIFVQPQFDQRNAETVARAIGGAVVVLDPLAENYVDNLRRMAAEIEAALSQVPPTVEAEP